MKPFYIAEEPIRPQDLDAIDTMIQRTYAELAFVATLRGDFQAAINLLHRVDTTAALQDIAAAGRQLDRFCKTEIHQRSQS